MDCMKVTKCLASSKIIEGIFSQPSLEKSELSNDPKKDLLNVNYSLRTGEPRSLACRNWINVVSLSSID